MIKLFYINLLIIFFGIKLLADPFTQEIGIVEEIIKEEPVIEETIKVEKEVAEVIEEPKISQSEKPKTTIVEKVKDEKLLTIINADPITAYQLKDYILRGIDTRKTKDRKPEFVKKKISNYDYGKIPTIHTITKGEDLNSIAFRYGFSVQEIKIVNALVPGTTKLITGNKLVVPSRFHRVKEDETLKTISKIYSIDALQLAAYNELDNDEYLIIGRKLLLPFFAHVTRKEEYLKDIASLYGREIEELLDINNIENKKVLLVAENQILKIPIHVNKNYNYDNLNKKSINDYFIDIKNLGIVEIKGAQFMIREGSKIGNKDGLVVSIFNKKMLVLENNIEYEFFINTPISGQSSIVGLPQNTSTDTQTVDESLETDQSANSANADGSSNSSSQQSDNQSTTNVEDLFN